MNRKFFNKLIAEHLLKEFPGFVTSKRGDLFVVPMEHLWRGFVFEASADSDVFYLNVNVIPLYMPAKFLWGGFGWRLGNMWFGNEGTTEELVRKLLAAMKTAQHQVLDRYRSPADIARACLESCGEKAAGTLEMGAYSLAFTGQFNESIPVLDELLGWYERLRTSSAQGPRQQELNCMVLRSLLRSGPQQAQAQLREWERQTIQNLKLDKFTN